MSLSSSIRTRRSFSTIWTTTRLGEAAESIVPVYPLKGPKLTVTSVLLLICPPLRSVCVNDPVTGMARRDRFDGPERTRTLISGRRGASLKRCLVPKFLERGRDLSYYDDNTKRGPKA